MNTYQITGYFTGWDGPKIQANSPEQALKKYVRDLVGAPSIVGRYAKTDGPDVFLAETPDTRLVFRVTEVTS